MLMKYMKERLWVLLLTALCAAVFAGVFCLYRLPLEAVGYGTLLCGVILLLSGIVGFLRYKKKIFFLTEAEHNIQVELQKLPDSAGEAETLYQTLLRELDDARRQAVSSADQRCRDTVDYFTTWVHQIKTPIAAIRLMLRDDERDRELGAELFRIEQYVELVLSYLRLDSESSDYVIKEYELEPILRQAARKYAPLFIRGRVTLELRESDLRVLTDEKWLQLVIEQVLSNAVKYAPGGRVAVYTQGRRLVIEDDGVGILPEDLPRIFDKGFTGCNGRMDKRATGIGLYLCRKVCGRLGHTIAVSSRPGEGTRVTIGLERVELEVE